MFAPQRDLTLAEVAELRRFTPRYLRELIRRSDNARIGSPFRTRCQCGRFDANSAIAAMLMPSRLPKKSQVSLGYAPLFSTEL